MGVMTSPRGTAPPSTRRRAERADAQENRLRILDAARRLLSREPSATMEDIAHEAGVGRMTLYGHYRTRAILLTAALEQALVDGEKQLSGIIDLGGAPREVLTRLLTSSWALVAESASLLTAADGVVPADQLKAMHAEPALRITALLRRGQAEGAFRRDLSDQWLGSAIHFILHGAATEVRNGNLSQDEAARVVVGTIDAMVRP